MRKTHDSCKKREREKARFERRLHKKRRKPVSGTLHMVNN
jgi:hypothetical protein